MENSTENEALKGEKRNNMEKYHILTKEEIVEKLKSMDVRDGKELPIRWFSFITMNSEYDPNGFSQEIEESENKIDLMEEMMKEISKPEFDFVWNNTLSGIKKNSHKWLKNHTKMCKLKLHPFAMLLSCVQFSDGSRNYASEENIKRIVEFSEKNGGIVSIG